MDMALLSQFLMLLLVVGVSLSQCPPREDILPCSCTLPIYSSDDFNVKVFCWKVNDVDEVWRALQSVKGIQRVFVKFEDSHLGSVPSDFFKGLHVSELSFYDCVLKRIGDEGKSALEGLEDSIEELSVENSFSELNELRFLNVSRLRALAYLNIEGNKLKEFGNEWFAEGAANLKKLDISRNKITRLGDKAFGPLTNLKELTILGNQIANLKRSMFPCPAIYLRTLDLGSNKISSLPVDFFFNMPALEYVFITRNFIQRIPEATWASVWSRLDFLDLKYNPLECDSHIEWTFKQELPGHLLGECVSPDERKGVNLEKIIDENQSSDEDKYENT